MATKVAVVTGVAQGIGKAFAGVLLKEGYKVGLFDINVELGKQTAEEFSSEFGSGSCVFLKCDVTDSQQLRDSYKKVEELFGDVSVVTNVAGIMDEHNWKKMVVNLKAVIDMTYIAVEKMRKDKGGTIVNVSSGTGIGVYPGFTGYTATKWGIIGFTKSMVASLALAETNWGITMIVFCPWATDTPMQNTTGIGAPRDKIEVCPAIPMEESRQLMSEISENTGLVNMEETASAFAQLLQDNRNGAVMKMLKEKGAPAKCFYIEQQWNETSM